MNPQTILYALTIIGGAAFAIYTTYREYRNSNHYDYSPNGMSPMINEPPPAYLPKKSNKSTTKRRKRSTFQDRKEDDCTICLSTMQKGMIVIMECNHMFHQTCITNWLKHKNECPICRAIV